jgi:hypothetical protein
VLRVEGNRTPASPQLYDPHTGAPVSLPPEQIHDAVIAGKVGFLKGEQVPVINPEGKATTIAAEDTPAAFGRGYKLETPDLQLERFNQEDYGQGVGNELKAGAAGAARMLTLGLSDQAMTKTGLVEPNTLESLKKYNPGATAIGEGVGLVAPMIATGGAAGAVEGAAKMGARDLVPLTATSKIGHAVSEGVGSLMGAEGAQTLGQKLASTIVPRAAGSAVEGAIFGVGNEVSEAALGDRDLNAEHIQANLGLGAIIGAGLGTAALPFEAGLKSMLTKEGAHTASADIAANAEAARTPNPDAPSLEEISRPEKYVKSQVEKTTPAKSLDEIAERVKNAKFEALDPSLPQQSALTEAIPHLPDLGGYEPHQMQIDSLDSPQKRDFYKTALEAPNPEGANLRDFEAIQKKKMDSALNNELRTIAPDHVPATDATEAGNRAVKAIRAPYEAEKKALGPAFKEIDEILGKTEAAQQDVLDVVTKAIPELTDHIQVGDGGLKLAPFTSKMGISERSYGVIKGVIRDIQDGPIKVSDIRKIRDSISSAIQHTADDNAPLFKMKSSLMDYMQSRVEKSGAEVGIRDVFKRYAQNEERRELAEYVLGGKLDGSGGLKKAIVPEDVIKNLFADSSTVSAIKELVGPSEFQKLAADWLSVQKNAVTKDGAFSSAKFGTFLSNKAPELAAAMGENMGKLKAIDALTTAMRLLPDAPSVNPSGTAKTAEILKWISGVGRLIKEPHKVVGEGLEHVSEAIDARQNRARINDALQGKGPTAGIAARAREKFVVLKNIETAGAEAMAKISGLAKGFVGNASRVAVPLSVGYLGDRRLAENKAERRKGDKYAMFQKRLDEVTSLASNPAALSERVAQNTGFLAAHAPGIADGLSATAVRAAQFLDSKAPKDPLGGFSLLAHTKKYQPADADIARWERYVTAIDHPLSVMHDLKNGALSLEGVEAIKTVYPKLYSQMTSALMEELTNLKHDLPFQKRLQLATFFDQPVDQASTPEFIAKMQATHAAASQSQQQAEQGINMSGSKFSMAKNNQSDMDRLSARA